MAKRRGGFPQMGGNMNHLMAQAQKMQKQIEQAQAEAAEMTGAGTAGGGMVAVEFEVADAGEVEPEIRYGLPVRGMVLWSCLARGVVAGSGCRQPRLAVLDDDHLRPHDAARSQHP